MVLAKHAALIALTLLASPAFADECAVEISSNDQMQYNTKAIQVPKSCKTFSVTLAHAGKLPVNVMGHNWVLSSTADMQGVIADAMAAGAAKGYFKDGDTRVIAHTKMLGGGEKGTATFDVAKLAAGQKYSFYCTFPGHSALMKGELTLAP